MIKRLGLILLLTLLGGWLRVSDLGARSLWLDEYTSLEVAAHSALDIARGSVFNNHTPPAYYLLLHAWLKVLPANESGLRSLSVLFDILNIVLVAMVFSYQFGARAGAAAGLFYTVSPYAVYYAQEGRMYSMLACLVLLTYSAALKIVRNPGASGAFVVLFLAASAGMYTHYYYPFLLCSLFLCCAFKLKDNRAALLKLITVMAFAGVVFAPWLPIVFEVFTGEGQSFRRFVFSVIPYAFFRFAAGYAVMPLNYGAKDDIVRTAAGSLPALLLYCGVFGAAAAAALRCLWKNFRGEALMLLMPLLFPLCLSLIISLYTPMLSERYLIVSYPFFIALLGLLVSPGAGSRAAALAPLMFFCLLFGLGRHYFNPEFGNMQWRKAASLIRKSEDECRKVVVDPEFCRGVLSFYLGSGWHLLTLDEFREQGVQCASYWLVESADGGASARRSVEENSGLKPAAEHLLPLENGLRITHYRLLP